VTTPEDVFENRLRRLEAEPQRIAGLSAKYRFEILGDSGGTWTLDIADSRAQLARGGHGEPDIKMYVSVADFVAMANGELEGQEAFMTGKLRIRGNVTLAMRLQEILG
jgi:putative sterol carrier protein